GKEPGRFEVHMAWMQEQLGPQQVGFLGQLPFSHHISPAGRGAPPGDCDLLIVHANPYDLERPILPQMRESDLDELLLAGELPRCEMLAFGHVHVPYIRHWRGRTLVDVASVGLPMDR